MGTNKGDDEEQRYRYSVEEAEALTGITQQQVSQWKRRLKEPEKYRATLLGAAYHKAFAGGGSPAHYEPGNTSWQGTNDWHTPGELRGKRI